MPAGSIRVLRERLADFGDLHEGAPKGVELLLCGGAGCVWLVGAHLGDELVGVLGGEDVALRLHATSRLAGWVAGLLGLLALVAVLGP